MVLVDTRDVAQAQYVAKRNLNLSLDELDDLGSIVGLTAYAPRTVPIRNSTTLNALPRMTSLIVINLIVLALLLGVIVFRRRFRGKPPMVVLAACLATGTGCIRSTTENANNEKQIQLEVTPAAVELRELATDCGTIPFSLNVENLSDCDVKVNVLPSCGCTNVDKTSFTLHSKASHKVSLNIAARGRSGMFNSSVRLVSYGTDPPSKSLELSVPISCVFRDDWNVRPQRIILKAGGEELGLVSISAPAKSWQGVIVDVIGTSVELLEISTNDSGSLETRNYQVRTNHLEASENQCIICFRDDRDAPFSTIPVLLRE